MKIVEKFPNSTVLINDGTNFDAGSTTPHQNSFLGLVMLTS